MEKARAVLSKKKKVGPMKLVALKKWRCVCVCVCVCVLKGLGEGGCASAGNGVASFSASFSRMLVFLRANRSFRGVFGFSDGDAKVWKRLSQWGLMRSLINQMKPGVNLHEDCLGTGS